MDATAVASIFYCLTISLFFFLSFFLSFFYYYFFFFTFLLLALCGEHEVANQAAVGCKRSYL